jgi:hypothetical protein
MTAGRTTAGTTAGAAVMVSEGVATTALSSIFVEGATTVTGVSILAGAEATVTSDLTGVVV